MADLKCRCDYCLARELGVHHYHLMHKGKPTVQKLIALDFAAGRMRPVYVYDIYDEQTAAIVIEHEYHPNGSAKSESQKQTERAAELQVHEEKMDMLNRGSCI